MSNGNRTEAGTKRLEDCQLTWNGYLFGQGITPSSFFTISTHLIFETSMDPFLYFFCEKRNRDVSQPQDIRELFNNSIWWWDYWFRRFTASEQAQLHKDSPAGKASLTSTRTWARCPRNHVEIASHRQMLVNPTLRRQIPEVQGTDSLPWLPMGRKKKVDSYWETRLSSDPPTCTHTPARNTIPLTIK